MGRDRAAYMREYRRRQRRETVLNTTMPAQAVRDLIDAQDRIRQLEDEVRHLKAELAKRLHEPIGRVTAVHDVIGPSGRGLRIEGERFNTRPFTPVPKHK